MEKQLYCIECQESFRGRQEDYPKYGKEELHACPNCSTENELFGDIIEERSLYPYYVYIKISKQDGTIEKAHKEEITDVLKNYWNLSDYEILEQVKNGSLWTPFYIYTVEK